MKGRATPRKDSHTWISSLDRAEKDTLNELIRVGCLFTVAEHREGEVRVSISHRGRLITDVVAPELPDAFREACAHTRSVLFSAAVDARHG